MKKYEIHRREVLRYLGYKKNMEIPQNIEKLLEWAKVLVLQRAVPKVVKGVFDIAVTNTRVKVQNTKLVLPSRQLAALMHDCTKIVLMAATLGVGIDNLIASTEKTDLTFSVVLDATATTLIEEVCDKENLIVMESTRTLNSFARPRFSPGYGDLPLHVQPNIISTLMADKMIGLTCNEDHLLIPRKSVTAVIGISDRPHRAEEGCEKCNLKLTCPYRQA